MARHTLKTWLEHLMRYDPQTGEAREENRPAVICVDGTDMRLDEIHNDFILGTCVFRHSPTQEWMPVTFKDGLTKQIVVPLALIRHMSVEQ